MKPSETELIIIRVARAFGYTADELYGRRRFTGLSWARQVAWAVLYARGMTYSEIARHFDRDHSTVMYGVRKVEAFRAHSNPRVFGALFR